MTAIRVATPRTLFSGPGSACIGKSIASSLNSPLSACTTGLRSGYYLLRPYNSPLGKRKFSSTTKQQLEVFPPPRDAPSIRVTLVIESRTYKSWLTFFQTSSMAASGLFRRVDETDRHCSSRCEDMVWLDGLQPRPRSPMGNWLSHWLSPPERDQETCQWSKL